MIHDHWCDSVLIVEHLVLGHCTKEGFCQGVVEHIGCGLLVDNSPLFISLDVDEGKELVSKGNLSERTERNPTYSTSPKKCIHNK